MVHELNIYGDIVPFHSGWSDEYSLKDLNADLGRLNVAENDELIINIHTFGGCTATAFGILNKLQRFKKENKISLTTRVDGWCASSGVIILLASDTKRIGNSYAEPFIHNAWTWTMGDKNEHQKKLEDLARVDEQISNLYVQKTNITKEEAVSLMNAESFVTAEKSLEYGFFTELEDVEVVEIEVMNSIKSNNIKNRQKIQNNMSDKNKDVAEKKSLLKRIENFLGLTTQNKIVFTAENAELDFYELNEEDTPKIGDKALFDGKPAGESNEGIYVVQSGETYTFEGEELKEITPKEEETEDTEIQVENEALKEEVQNLKEEIKNLKAEKLTINNSLKEATSIIKNFQDINTDDDDDEEDDKSKRDPKKKTTPPKRNLFQNLKH